jgi:hypothetical protein
MVPTGMDFWASARSPERFDPAIIPTDTRTHYFMYLALCQGRDRKGTGPVTVIITATTTSKSIGLSFCLLGRKVGEMLETNL